MQNCDPAFGKRVQSIGAQFTLLSLSAIVCGSTIQALHLMRPTENLSTMKTTNKMHYN